MEFAPSALPPLSSNAKSIDSMSLALDFQALEDSVDILPSTD